MPILASQLPRRLADAFINAIEGWSEAEHALFMLWQFLDDERAFQKKWVVFSTWGTARQRGQTEALIRKKVTDPASRQQLLAVLKGMEALTDTRNRIIHGRWQAVNLWEDERHVGVEYLRVYDARGNSAMPTNEYEEQAMLGRTRFYADDLKGAEKAFRDLARQLALGLRDVVVSGVGRTGSKQ